MLLPFYSLHEHCAAALVPSSARMSVIVRCYIQMQRFKVGLAVVLGAFSFCLQRAEGCELSARLILRSEAHRGSRDTSRLLVLVTEAEPVAVPTLFPHCSVSADTSITHTMQVYSRVHTRSSLVSGSGSVAIEQRCHHHLALVGRFTFCIYWVILWQCYPEPD